MKSIALTLALVVIFASSVLAETRTISATGEYRMGDNDTRTDAKRLALQDAKRLALEKAGTYIESISEVKNFALSRDELRAYTAGIVEVLESATQSTMEGETTVVRVDVTCKIDTAVVSRQIQALRRNEMAKADLLRSQQDAEKLRQENEQLRQQLAAAKSKAEIETISQKRRTVLTHQDVNALLAQAWGALGGSESDKRFIVGASSPPGRARAKGLIEQALILDGSEAQAHNQMGILLAEEGNLEGAVASFHTALRLRPDDARFHANLGYVLGAKGDVDGAIAEYHTALRLQPGHAGFHAGLGNALQAKGNLDGAIAAYRAALGLSPKDAYIHSNLARALMRNGDLDTAIAEFRTAVLLAPNVAEMHTDLGMALRAKGDQNGAIAAYRDALRLKPDHAGAHFDLGLILKAQGQRAAAAHEFREFLRLAPPKPDYTPFIEKAKAALRELE